MSEEQQEHVAQSPSLGIIQSRGLGDIVIALPIAKYYHDQGINVYWPIAEEFVPSVEHSVPWVNWVKISADHGPFFYDVPMKALSYLNVDNVICLYQSLTNHPELSSIPEFQITKFDQIKYHRAQVPFLKKWTLQDCITRDSAKELELYNSLNLDPNKPLAVIHNEGSDHTANIDPNWIPSDYQIVYITPDRTESIFNWLTVIERADVLIAVDSVIANIVDQLNLTEDIDCYWIPRSHIHLTPVLGGSWTILEPSPEVTKRITIFRSN